eukprot:1860630-Pyramimonas_sp.AAC.1
MRTGSSCDRFSGPPRARRRFEGPEGSSVPYLLVLLSATGLYPPARASKKGSRPPGAPVTKQGGVGE